MQAALDYFAEKGYVCPRNCNPADYLLDLATDLPLGLVEAQKETFTPSVSLASIQEVAQEFHEFSSESGRRYASYWLDQFALLCQRTIRNNLRNPYLLRLQYLITVVMSLLIGFIFFRLSYDSRGTQDRFGVLFFMSSLCAFGSMSSLDLCKHFYSQITCLVFQERSLFVRERSNGLYSTSAYFFAKALCDIVPMRIIPALLMGGISYYLVQLHPGLHHFFVTESVLVMVSLVSVSLCFAVR